MCSAYQVTTKKCLQQKIANGRMESLEDTKRRHIILPNHSHIIPGRVSNSVLIDYELLQLPLSLITALYSVQHSRDRTIAGGVLGWRKASRWEVR